MEMQEHFDAELEKLTSGLEGPLTVLLGVSGGVDSMCMADLFLHSRLPVRFSVAHVNFSLRGDESDGDEALVRLWCADHRVDCYVNRFDTHAYADENSISTQMAARDLRYNWFRQLMDEHGIRFLSIAHNLNDSVETLFLNLLRGTGMNGLSGIRSSNGPIIRPMLGFSRASIAAYASSHGVVFREDSTNRESHYSRNRIRNQVFPQFAQINPSFLDTITTSMHRFSEVAEILDEQYRAREGVLYRSDGNLLLIDIGKLKEEKFRSYWLYRMLDSYGFNDTQLSQIGQSIEGQSGKIFDSPTHRLVRDREFLKVYPLGNISGGHPGCDSGRDCECAGVGVRFKVVSRTDSFDPKEAPQGTLYVDFSKVNMPLHCRKWKPADRFKPLGMNGFKKLSDYFTDLKLDVEQKKRETVVTTVDKKGMERIVCIAGRRIDDRFKIDQDTVRVVVISTDKQ